MSNNMEVRLLPNGHPYIFLPQLPNFQTLPLIPQVPQFPQELPPIAPLSPMSSLSQFAQAPPQQQAPFDQVLNAPFSTPQPPQQPVPVGLANSLMDILNAQIPLLAPTFNPFLPFAMSSVTLMPVQPTPVPLMSLRISTPPTLRAHPYQRTDSVIRRTTSTRQRNNSHNGQQRSDTNGTNTVIHAPQPIYPYAELLGATLRKEAEQQAENNESWRHPM